MKKFNIMIAGSVLLFISACVTINVYFPAAEAENAAAKIVNKIIGEDTKEVEINNPQSSLNILGWFISSAHAQVNINISSPAISEITARMKDRYDGNLKQYLDTQVIGFSNLGFISSLYEKDMDLITIKNELALVYDYIELEKMRFEERLTLEVVFDKNLADFKIPTLSIQLLVENAIKHGIDTKIEGGLVAVHIKRESNFLSIQVLNP